MNPIRLISLYLVFFGITAIVGCRNTEIRKPEDNPVIDTTRSFKIDNTWVTPKPDFGFDTLTKATNDTLDLVICSDYVYFPFGPITKRSELNNTSLLKNFKVTTHIDTLMPQVQDSWMIEYQILTLNSNKLILWLPDKLDSEASVSSYIRKGEINDDKVTFINNVKIGMSIGNFYNVFFENFPKELQSKYKVIIFESCITGIIHYYYFNDNKLIRIKFDNTDKLPVFVY